MIASWLDPDAGTRAWRPAMGSLLARRPQSAGGSRSHCCKVDRDFGGAIKMGVIIVNGERCLKTGNMRQQLVVIFHLSKSL